MVRISFGLVAASLILSGCIFVRAAFPPDIPAPAITVEPTEARLARGAYLVEHHAACFSCHAERDWTKFAAPIVEETKGSGGEIFDEVDGVPGVVPSSNITPARLSTWSDGDILRAIAYGQSKDGTALFPTMPYRHYRAASREDLYAIIAYIRTLPSVEKTWPERNIEGVMGFITRALPEAVDLRETSPRPGDVDYPAYVTQLAGCTICHTPVDDRSRPIEGQDFAGGRVYTLPTGGSVWSANLTPDDDTGIGRWSREDFIQRFHATTRESARKIDVAPGSFNTVMPWTDYAGMTDEDLGAIYDHLRGLPPMRKNLEKFTPAGPPVATPTSMTTSMTSSMDVNRAPSQHESSVAP